MSRLFIALYLDEDVDVLIAELLGSRGFEVLTTRKANQLSATDEDQLAKAVQLGMALVTHNRVHFETLAQDYMRHRQLHCGIIIATRRRPYEIVHRLLQILNRVTADELENQVRYI